MRNAETQLTSVLEELCNIVHAIEDEQFRLFARRQYLTRLEREVRDGLLRLLAADFPEMVSEYTELNRKYDEVSKASLCVRVEG